jgi:hypothetical protein
MKSLALSKPMTCFSWKALKENGPFITGQRGGVGRKKRKEDRIPELTVKDRSGGLTGFVLESPSKAEIHEALTPIVNAECVIAANYK